MLIATPTRLLNVSDVAAGRTSSATVFPFKIPASVWNSLIHNSHPLCVVTWNAFSTVVYSWSTGSVFIMLIALYKNHKTFEINCTSGSQISTRFASWKDHVSWSFCWLLTDLRTSHNKFIDRSALIIESWNNSSSENTLPLLPRRNCERQKEERNRTAEKNPFGHPIGRSSRSIFRWFFPIFERAIGVSSFFFSE